MLTAATIAVLLRFRASGGNSGGLRGHGGHGDSGYLVDDVHRLHDRCGAGRGSDNGGRSHGVGHRLNGRLRQRAVHGDQDWLVAEGGACWWRRGEVMLKRATKINTESRFC